MISSQNRMDSYVSQLRLLTFCAFCCYASQLSSRTLVAQAFLFHQLQPESSSVSSLYSSFNNQNATSNSNHYNNYQPQVRSSYTSRIQNDQQGSSNYFTRESGGINDEQPAETNSCPTECHCNKVAQIADCSNRNLLKVPTGFPKDIKRIRLERNNITELGPYAFQGLKRLQRIDLSNNNLNKIDPLAFAGGLPSLNSLILYSNKLNQLPTNLFDELSQLQLLLLNANSLQCINKELFQSLTNLNLLSLYDNNIETLVNGTFDGLKSIKTIHLGKNPLVCDCNLRWLADYLELNPIETSEAKCEGPARNQGKKLSQLSQQKFRCEGNEQSKTSRIANLCAPIPDQPCPAGCTCKGVTVDCSRVSQTESRTGGGIYELPDIPDNVTVYVTQMRINDNRIKRIRQTGLFRRLANSQKLDLGGSKIIDIEDNSINGAGGSTKPERIVFVLLENEHCSSRDNNNNTSSGLPEDACSTAPKVNAPNFDSPCYNGGSCINTGRSTGSSDSRSSGIFLNFNYSCLCPPGFAGPLCEINIDDCVEHQCQNGAMCVDGVNSYKCVCRDPTTSGEFCEQLNSFASNSANSISPMALPMISASAASNYDQNSQPQHQVSHQQVITRSADLSRTPLELAQGCKKVTQRKYYDDGNGCQSVRVLKISECSGSCGPEGCCSPAKIKRRRVRMQCSDGASYVKTVDLVKKCACTSECAAGRQVNHSVVNQYLGQYNASQEDQLMQITRLDAIE